MSSAGGRAPRRHHPGGSMRQTSSSTLSKRPSFATGNPPGAMPPLTPPGTNMPGSGIGYNSLSHTLPARFSSSVGGMGGGQQNALGAPPLQARTDAFEGPGNEGLAPIRGHPTIVTLEQRFNKSKALLNDLWTRMNAPPSDRQQFAAVAFTEASRENVEMMETEIQRLWARQLATLRVDKAIEIREASMYQLQELAERSSVMGGIESDRMAVDVTQKLQTWRVASLEVVDAVQAWREVVMHAEAIYAWKGASYLNKMLGDMDFFVISRLAGLLDFSVVNNPFLFPGRGEEIASEDQDGKRRLPPVKAKRGNDKAHNEMLERVTLAERILRDETRLLAKLRNKRRGLPSRDGEPRDAGFPDFEDEPTAEDEWLNRGMNKGRALEERAATRIQSLWRGYCDRKRATMLRQRRDAATKIQKLGRMYLAKKKVQEKRTARAAACKIQALTRGMLGRSMVAHIHLQLASATRIQAAWRGHCGRRRANWLRSRRDAATDIGRVWRGYWVRVTHRRVDDARRERAAIVIQALFRGALTRMRPELCPRKIVAAIKIQAWWRGIEARRLVRYLKRRWRAAVKVQAWWRGCLGRRLAHTLQDATWDARFASYLRRLDAAARDIQRVWAGYKVRKQTRRELKRRAELSATASIQRVYRGHASRQSTNRELIDMAREEASTRIQTSVRGWIARRRVRLMALQRTAATAIQRVWEGHCGRRRARELRNVKKLQNGQAEAPEIELWKKMGIQGVPAPAVPPAENQTPRTPLTAYTDPVPVVSYTSLQHDMEIAAVEMAIKARRNGAALKMQLAVRVFLARCRMQRASAAKLMARVALQERNVQEERTLAAYRIQAFAKRIARKVREEEEAELKALEEERQRLVDLERQMQELKETLMRPAPVPPVSLPAIPVLEIPRVPVEQVLVAQPVEAPPAAASPTVTEEKFVAPASAPVVEPSQVEAEIESTPSASPMVSPSAPVSALASGGAKKKKKVVMMARDEQPTEEVQEAAHVAPATVEVAAPAAIEEASKPPVEPVAEEKPSPTHKVEVAAEATPPIDSIRAASPGLHSLALLMQCAEVSQPVLCMVGWACGMPVPENAFELPPSREAVVDEAKPARARVAMFQDEADKVDVAPKQQPAPAPASAPETSTGLHSLSLLIQCADTTQPGLCMVGLSIGMTVQEAETRGHKEPKSPSISVSTPSPKKAKKGVKMAATPTFPTTQPEEQVQPVQPVRPTQPARPIQPSSDFSSLGLLLNSASLMGDIDKCRNLSLVQQVVSGNVQRPDVGMKTPQVDVVQNAEVKTPEVPEVEAVEYAEAENDIQETEAVPTPPTSGDEEWELVGDANAHANASAVQSPTTQTSTDSPTVGGLSILLGAARGTNVMVPGLEALGNAIRPVEAEPAAVQIHINDAPIEKSVDESNQPLNALSLVASTDDDLPFLSKVLNSLDEDYDPEVDTNAIDQAPVELESPVHADEQKMSEGENVIEIDSQSNEAISQTFAEQIDPFADRDIPPAQQMPGITLLLSASSEAPGAGLVVLQAVAATKAFPALSAIVEIGQLFPCLQLLGEALAYPYALPTSSHLGEGTEEAATEVGQQQPQQVVEEVVEEKQDDEEAQQPQQVEQQAEVQPSIPQTAEEPIAEPAAVEVEVPAGSSDEYTVVTSAILEGRFPRLGALADAADAELANSEALQALLHAGSSIVPTETEAVANPAASAFPVLDWFLSMRAHSVSFGILRNAVQDHVRLSAEEAPTSTAMAPEEAQLREIERKIAEKTRMEARRAEQYQLESLHADQLSAQHRARIEEERQQRHADAAKQIQSNWRGHTVRVNIEDRRQEYRERQVAVAAERRLEQEEAAVRTIQETWQSVGKPNISQKKGAAASVVQRNWRGHLARKEANRRRWRRQRAREEDRFEEESTNDAAVTIQSKWRQHVAIEKRRDLLQDRRMQAMVPSAETIQRAIRCFRARAEAARRRRAKLSQLQGQKHEDRRSEASTKIQLAWKCHRARVELAHRQFLAREKRKAALRTLAAIRIQRQARGFLARRELRRRRAAMRQSVEAAKRREVVHEEEEKRLEADAQAKDKADSKERLENAAAGVIQRAYKSYDARFRLRWMRAEREEQRREHRENEFKSLQQRSATKVQAQWRGAVARSAFRDRWAQVKVDRQSQRVEEEERNAAAAAVQRAYRCYNSRFEANWRRQDVGARAQRQEVAVARSEKEEIDAVMAALQARRERAQRETAAVTIQCAWRSHNARFELAWRREKARNREAALVARAAAAATARGQGLSEDGRTRSQQGGRLQVNIDEDIDRTGVRASTGASPTNTLGPRTSHVAAALVIQCAWRCSIARHEVSELRDSARRASNRVVESERKANAATKIQSAYRGRLGKFEGDYRRACRSFMAHTNPATAKQEAESKARPLAAPADVARPPLGVALAATYAPTPVEEAPPKPAPKAEPVVEKKVEAAPTPTPAPPVVAPVAPAPVPAPIQAPIPDPIPPRVEEKKAEKVETPRQEESDANKAVGDAAEPSTAEPSGASHAAEGVAQAAEPKETPRDVVEAPKVNPEAEEKAKNARREAAARKIQRAWRASCARALAGQELNRAIAEDRAVIIYEAARAIQKQWRLHRQRAA